MSLQVSEKEGKTIIKATGLELLDKDGNTTLKIDEEGNVFIKADKINLQGGVK